MARLSELVKINVRSALESYMRGYVVKTHLDKKGFEHISTYKDWSLGKDLGIPAITIWRWRKTGSISPAYRKLLIQRGILKESDFYDTSLQAIVSRKREEVPK